MSIDRFLEILKECPDPIEQAINLQYSQPLWNEIPSVETIIINAIDEKSKRIPAKMRVIHSLIIQGFSYEMIGIKLSYSKRQVIRIVKKMSPFY